MSGTPDVAETRLANWGEARRQGQATYEAAHQAALDAALEELGRGTVTATRAAALIGVARATIYNELERRRNGAGGPGE